MAGTAGKDNVAGNGSTASEGTLVGQNCQAGDLLAEWRSCEQVENDTPSTSPPYWDTDDDDDHGPKPSELYGKFTWRIENFSQISKRELRSNAFEVGGYKWYILIYPQGCDVCNHLSLFLCVANHDRLLPGWSHFAQFTIAVVNKDPKKSKYSDTLHRFWKKEHDWGWKKFMELSKIIEGFIDADTLVIKAQVQVIREKANRPFRCLDRQYRRELVRVYLSNVENICRRFVEERRGMLSKLIEDRASWSGFRLFWLGIDQTARRRMSRDKTDAILKVIVKHFFVEKEVTSTLVMDSLYSGLKALEYSGQSESKKETNKSAEIEEMPPSIVDVKNGMFILADDALVLLERTALETLPPKDDKGTQGQNQNQNRIKDGSSSEEFSRDSVERDEKRLTELGRRTLEVFILTHIFSSKIEVAYQEVVAFQRQEELIREEEAAGQAEIEHRAKHLAAEKEKRAKKKQSKQKRNNRKGKDRTILSKMDLISANTSIANESHNEKLDDFSTKSEETFSEKVEILDDASDVSDTGAGISETVEHVPVVRVASPRTWGTSTDVCEVVPGAEDGTTEIPNNQLDKKCRSAIDDSSSTCSTDSIPSVVTNIGIRTTLLPSLVVPSRGRNRRNKAARRRSSQQTNYEAIAPSPDSAPNAGYTKDATGHSRSTPEREIVLPSNSRIQLPEPDLIDKREDAPYLQNNTPTAKELFCQSTTEVHPKKVEPSLSSLPYNVVSSSSQQPKQSAADDSAEPISSRESSSNVPRPLEKLAHFMSKPLHNVPAVKPDIQKSNTAKVSSSNEVSPLSRPLSAPIIADVKPTVPVVSTVSTPPLLSRSVSAFERFSANEVPSSSHSYVPMSYRNAMMGKSSDWSNSLGYAPGPSPGKGTPFSQPSGSVVTFPDSAPARTVQITTRPGLNFGSVNPKTLATRGRNMGGCLVQELGGNTLASSSADAGFYTEDLASGVSARPVQSNTADEFPHLDIINYLLEEDCMDPNVPMNGRSCLVPSGWQYGAPGNLAGVDTGHAISSSGFNGADLYYDDANGTYDPYHHPLGMSRDLLSHEIDSQTYTSSEMDGWMLGHWPLGTTIPAEHNPHPYQLQDYSNLACGVSGYTMYPPANGF